MIDEATDAATPSTLTYEPPRWVVTPAADIAAIVLRLLGVKMVIDLIAGLSQIPMYWAYLNDPSTMGTSPWIGVGISIVWNAAMAAILFATARPVAEAIFGRRTLAAHDLGTGAWMMLIVSGVGLAYAIFSLESTVTGIAAIVTRVRMNVGPAMPRAVEPAELMMLVAPLLKTALGLLLFFRPSLLATPWLRGVAPTETRQRAD